MTVSELLRVCLGVLLYTTVTCCACVDLPASNKVRNSLQIHPQVSINVKFDCLVFVELGTFHCPDTQCDWLVLKLQTFFVYLCVCICYAVLDVCEFVLLQQTP